MDSATLPDFPHYLVWPNGRIYSERKRKFLSPAVDAKGYCRQPMRRADGKVVCLYLHRVIATCFLPNPENLPEVDHRDGNPRNNAVENLRWITHGNNIRAAIARRGNWFQDMPKRTTPILRIDPRTGEERRFDSIRAACEEHKRATVANGGIAKAPELFAGNICNARDKLKVAYDYFWVSPRKRLPLAVVRAKVAESRA